MRFKYLTLPCIVMCNLMLSACSSSTDSTGSNSSTTVLAGNWSFHSLRSGTSPRWRYGSDQIDADGIATRIDITRSSTNQDVGAPYTLSIDTNNTTTRNDDATYHGTLANDDLIVNTQSKSSNSAFRLQFMQKKSGAYALSDLQGDWNFHTLSTGNTSGWTHGEEQIDGSGNVNRISIVNNDNNAILGSNYTLSIDAQGNITRADKATYHGSISADKSLMINTRSIESATTFRIKILQKKGGSFSTADLAGTWDFHNLMTGTDASWVHGVDMIDSSGVVTNASRLFDDGDTSLRPAHTLTIDANGIISRSDRPSYHGVMSQDKKLMIITVDTGTNGTYHMRVLQRRN